MEPTREQNLKAFDQVIQLLQWFSYQTELLQSVIGRRMASGLSDILARERDDYASRTEEEAEDADLARAVVSSVRQDAELLRKAEREVRADECRSLVSKLCRAIADDSSDLAEALDIICDRIRELEAEEE